ncbi:MAG: arylsulfatase [Cyclobacteriaceae bacterium]|nr:arylsulfatase [Cyclobacteriaceae bacterium]
MIFLLSIAMFSCEQEAPKKPNVIYILADDLGYGDLSCYGQTKFRTPNIDRLAKEGMKFTNHYSGNTVCSPSRAVLMTGQHPGHIFLRGNISGEDISLDPKMTVLPEIFKAAGYATGAFGKWGLGQTNEPGAKNPLSNGFDVFCGWKSQTIAHTYYPSSYVYNGEELPLDPGTFVHDIVMDSARAFIRRNADSKQPFFCYIPTAVPHAAMHAPAALHEKWRRKFPEYDNRIGKYKAGPTETCPDVQNPIAGFPAMMENLDNEIGKILDLIKSMGIDDNTLIVFASDNGAHHEGGHDPNYWNSTGSLRGLKRDMHEGGIRTPMLARWPTKIAKGSISNHISAFWDVLPTMSQLVGQPVPEQSDGISFMPTLLNQDAQPKHDYMYWEFTKGNEQKLFSQAIRKEKWKAYLEVEKPMEIFNLEEDPYEQNDLAADMPEMVAEMNAIIAVAHTPLQTKQ